MFNMYAYTGHLTSHLHYNGLLLLYYLAGSRLEIVCERKCEILFQQSLIYCITVLFIIL